ncbi:MAG TPA: hypothetical protein PK694_02915 [Rhodospirillales bacterium]|nr:hypothetical protein [Rhodospirillales bacterium]
MQIELIVALVSAAVALISAGFTLWGQIRTTRLAADLEALRLVEQRRFDAEKTIARYREPLARAAYDLQSRLYNILEQKLILAHFENGDERSRSHVLNNTTFLIAQYFSWTEIVRRDIQYIDLGQDEETRILARLQDDIYSLFQTARFPAVFRVFAGEQRAIGERMIREGARGLEPLGYAAFLDQVANGSDPMIEALRHDVQALATELPVAGARLVALQHALVDLLGALDPDGVRFPQDRRTKVHAPRVRLG